MRWISDVIHRLLKTTVSGVTFPHLARVSESHMASSDVRRLRTCRLRECHYSRYVADFFQMHQMSWQTDTSLARKLCSFTEQPVAAAGRLALVYCLSNLPSTRRQQTQQSTAPRVARSLVDSLVRLCVWGMATMRGM